MSSSTSLSTKLSATGGASKSAGMSTDKVNKPLPFTPGGLFLDVASKARTDTTFAEKSIVENTPREKSLSPSGKIQAEKTIATAALPPLAPQLGQKKSSDDAAMPPSAPPIENGETAKDADQKKRNLGFGSRIKNFLRKEFSESEDPKDTAWSASTNENKALESKALESKANGKKIPADSAIEKKIVPSNSSLTNKAPVKGPLPEAKSTMPPAAPPFFP